jgi:parallel beta-helix repeat protein
MIFADSTTIRVGERNFMKRLVSGTMLTLLLTSMLTLAFNIQPVKAEGTIYIRADGSVDPPTAPISTVDNITYTLTGNITADADGIVIERDSIVVDGAGNYITPNGWSGITLSGRSNVTIKNTNIQNSWYGIYLYSSSSNSISENYITTNAGGISLVYSSNNTISGNNMPNNWDEGIALYFSSNYNSISGNNITNTVRGFWINSCSNNTIFGNNITACGQGPGQGGIVLQSSSGNSIFHDNLVNNNAQVFFYTSDCADVWDDGYPSGGNYWSDYTGVDLYNGPYQNITGNDGIGDTPYIIDANNRDQYPLMTPYQVSYTLTILSSTGGTTDPTPGVYTYAAGSNISVTAIPDTNYAFDHWELDGANIGVTNPITVTMDTNHTLHAVFRIPIHDIAVTNITSSKTVVGQGYSVNITVTVANQGDYTETFNVMVYHDKLAAPSPEQWDAFFADINRDGYVDGIDLGIIGANWFHVGENPADVDHSGRVDLADSNLVGLNWGKDIWTDFELQPPPIGKQGDSLASRAFTTLTFIWNTTDVPYGNYTISAYAPPFIGTWPFEVETETADNTYTDGLVKVTVAGDINGDGIVNAGDLGLLGAAWFSNPNSPNWNPNADVTGDMIVNAGDLGIIGVNWFKT